MLKKSGKVAYLTIISAAVLFIGLFSLGCKEEPSGTTPTIDADAQSAEDQSPAASTDTTGQEATEPVVDEVKSGAESEAQIAKIVAGAKTWGAVNKSWYGKAVPDFEMTALDGTTHKFSEYKGKKVLLVFWATWCPPCRAEVPDLNELRADSDKEKIAIVAVAGAARGAPPDTLQTVRPFAQAMQISYDVFIEKGELPDPFGVSRLYTTTGVPGSFIIDAKGIIRLQTAGIVPRADIEGLLDAI